MAEKYLSHPSVRHVTARLTDIGHPHQVIALADTARSAQEAAAALGVEVGAIVKTLMFVHGDDDVPVIALIAGDRQCDAAALAARVGSSVACRRPDAARVKAATGYAIGGVSPVGLPDGLPVSWIHRCSASPPSGLPPGIRTAFSRHRRSSFRRCAPPLPAMTSPPVAEPA